MRPPLQKPIPTPGTVVPEPPAPILAKDDSVDWMYLTPDVIDRRTMRTDPPIDLTTLSPGPVPRADDALPTVEPEPQSQQWAAVAGAAVMFAGVSLALATLVTLGAAVALFFG